MARGPGRGGGGRGRGRGRSRGRGTGAGSKPPGKIGGGRQQGGDEAPFGLDDIDAFHKQRDTVKLNLSDDEDDSEADSELEAAAYQLDQDSGSDDSSDDEDDEDEPSDEDEDADAALQAAIQRGGRIGRLAKAAKAVGQRVALQQGLDEEGAGSEGEDDDDLERRRLWGANKRAYHGADETDDEEAAKEEEEEALRLQREQQAALRPEDYDDAHLFPGEGDAVSSSEDEDDADAEPALGSIAAAQANGKVHVERLQRDGAAALGTDEARAIVERDAPELLALLEELKDSLQELRSRVGPVLAQVKAGELATAEGLSYLEAKHLLLLSYCIHIVFYVLLKAEGAPVRDHPVIGRLLQLRTYLEKLRPIDKKLAYQVEKLLAAGQRAPADGADGAAADPLSFGPRPEALVPRSAAGNAADPADAGVYRPPRLAMAAMEDDPDRRQSAKERRREREASRRGGRSALLQELAQEVEGAPEEAPAVGGGGGADVGAESAAVRRQLHALQARAAIEEDMMMRVPLFKDQRKSLKAQRRAALSGKALHDDFADDVAELVAAAGDADGIGDDVLDRRLVSQRYGADAASNPKGRSGDEDLPLRDPLHERRARYDSVKARHAAADAGDGGSKRMCNTDDADYQALAEEQTTKKKARKEACAVPDTLPPLPDPAADGARKISTAIEKNRGLTPHRAKAGKNPRKKNRTKFEKAQVRRGGQVQEAREKTPAYGGEATGIKAKVSKSRRF